MPDRQTLPEHSKCSHADVEMMRCAQMEDDEIEVMVLMVTSGRCPQCHPERFHEYQRSVEARRLCAERWGITLRGDGRELASLEDQIRADEINARLAEIGTWS